MPLPACDVRFVMYVDHIYIYVLGLLLRVRARFHTIVQTLDVERDLRLTMHSGAQLAAMTTSQSLRT